MVRASDSSRGSLLRDRLRVVTGRRAVIVIMVLVATALLLSVVLPQESGSGAASLPDWSRVLGADRIVTTPGFRILLAVAALQLFTVTLRIARRDIRRLRRERGPAATHPFEVASSAALAEALHAARYRRVAHSSSVARYVKAPWGYAGPTLLHAGITSALACVLLVSVTDSVGLVTIFEGETLPAGTSLDAAERGPLGAETVLSEDLAFEALDLQYWQDGSLRSATGTYRVPSVDAAFDLTVNAPRVVGGVRYFQEQRVGYVFAVTLTRDGVPERLRLEMPVPPLASKASYLDRPLLAGDVLLAKCMHDPNSADGSPELTLRLMRDGQVLAEQSFAATTTATMAEYDVSLDIVSRWSIVSLERSRGYELLFGSFFVIGLGALLIYGAPPRELTLVRRADGTIVGEWYASRFAELYAEERERLCDAAAEDGSDR